MRGIVRITMVGTIGVAVALGLGQGRAETAVLDGGVLGPVTIPLSVRANGALLAAGTYAVRITSESSESERWVEFLSGDAVAGRELATVIEPNDITAVAKLRPPRPGEARVDQLRDAEYLRVWMNDADTHFLVHLPLA
jgi:hypothetical protein